MPYLKIAVDFELYFYTTLFLVAEKTAEALGIENNKARARKIAQACIEIFNFIVDK